MKVDVPFFIVTGASGSGKTFIVPELRKALPAFDVFDVDMMKGDDWQLKKINWLRVAYSIALSGRGTVLCGTILPRDVDRCDYHDRFSQIHVANLHCSEPIRRTRLGERKWSPEMIQKHVEMAAWLLDHKDTAFAAPMEVIDGGETSPACVAQEIAAWVTTLWSLSARQSRATAPRAAAVSGRRT